MRARLHERTPLQPFTGRRNRTDRAPQASCEWNEDEHQQPPPHDPNKDDAKVATARRCADESRENCQHKKRQRRSNQRPLQPAAGENPFDDWNSGEVNTRFYHKVILQNVKRETELRIAFYVLSSPEKYRRANRDDQRHKYRAPKRKVRRDIQFADHKGMERAARDRTPKLEFAFPGSA